MQLIFAFSTIFFFHFLFLLHHSQEWTGGGQVDWGSPGQKAAQETTGCLSDAYLCHSTAVPGEFANHQDPWPLWTEGSL